MKLAKQFLLNPGITRISKKNKKTKINGIISPNHSQIKMKNTPNKIHAIWTLGGVN